MSAALERQRERVLPPPLRSRDADDADRARVLVALCALAVPAGLFALVMQFRAGGMLTVAIMSVAVPLVGASAFVLRATGSVQLAGNLLVGVLFLSFSALNFATLGAAPIGLYWSAAIPMLAVLVVGPRAGCIWAALVALEISVVYAVSGGSPWVVMSADALQGSTFRGAIYLDLVAVAVALTYERARRKTVGEMQAARHRAEEASRAKGVFLANMSHEIRTPLNGILGMAQVVSESKLDADQRVNLEIIRQTGEALLQVLNDVLDLASVEAGRLSIHSVPFEPRTCVAAAVDTIHPVAAEKGLTLEVQIDPDVPAWVLGDSGRVRQVLLNLVNNAVKFTSVGGVTVSVLRSAGDPDGLCIQVRDTGIGIAASDHPRVFEEFVQVDPSNTRKHGGSGLGLSIARALVQRMGGRMGFESDLGAGSCFWFDLPLLATEPVAPAAAETSGPVSRALRVLVADDNAVNRRVARHHLERLGCTVAEVTDGREAVEAVALDAFDVVLMDCQMPELDGYGATQEIRRREGPAEHLVIIALTAHAMREDRDRCLAAGMDDYLSKPVARASLRAALERAILKHPVTTAPRSCDQGGDFWARTGA